MNDHDNWNENGEHHDGGDQHHDHQGEQHHEGEQHEGVQHHEGEHDQHQGDPEPVLATPDEAATLTTVVRHRQVVCGSRPPTLRMSRRLAARRQGEVARALGDAAEPLGRIAALGIDLGDHEEFQARVTVIAQRLRQPVDRVVQAPREHARDHVAGRISSLSSLLTQVSEPVAAALGGLRDKVGQARGQAHKLRSDLAGVELPKVDLHLVEMPQVEMPKIDLDLREPLDRVVADIEELRDEVRHEIDELRQELRAEAGKVSTQAGEALGEARGALGDARGAAEDTLRRVRSAVHL